jgi:fatty-acyl-CoA synthase
VQFSSGSTRRPLGVDIGQDQLMANIDGSLASQQIDADDSGVSWLPLYHDMGLIGFVLAPMCAQRSVDLLAPRDFARRPLQWLSLISRRRATITYSPSFGYELVARRAQAQMPGDVDLSCLKLAGVGADMIRPAALGRFADIFASRGFDARAFMASYGLAEVCVGLSFGRRFGGLRTDRRGSREFVLCGRPLMDHRVEIRDDSGNPLGERDVGRLFVSGRSVMRGYFGEVEESARALAGGWLDTGDLGYWCDGELVITGRAKDLIIVNGRNIWPQDIEWAIETRRVVKNGDSVAFSVDSGDGEGGGERVVVAVLARVSGEEGRETLGSDVAQAVREAIAVDCEVVLVPPSMGLPTTSSGKLSRSRAKANYLAGLYAPKTAAA